MHSVTDSLRHGGSSCSRTTRRSMRPWLPHRPAGITLGLARWLGHATIARTAAQPVSLAAQGRVQP